MISHRGSCWAKWDLHIHTPSSLVHQYPGGPAEAWESFISDIEALPASFKVIGVNDYFFLDGYRKVLEAWDCGAGRMSNIELFLPVIELRLRAFGGSQTRLSKVNYHVIFSDQLNPDVIEEQFIRALSSKFQLSPQYKSNEPVASTWEGALSRESMRALGAAIIASLPKDKREEYHSPLIEGFNNLTVSLSQIQSVLKRSFLRNRHITGVGKSEWADYKWQDGAIADKKNIVNSVDMLFSASPSSSSCRKARVSLVEAGVNSHLLDCSDAHYLSTHSDKDRIGNCNTWIKAVPSFPGLKQALKEFEHRVVVANTPAELRRVREYPSKYVERIQIQPTEDARENREWFDVNLILNPGLIAVIGNKGTGKSALAESIALLGNSDVEGQFSFLTKTKFRDPRDQLAQQFEATLEWKNGDTQHRLLAEATPDGAPSRVRHLPQRYLESLCDELPSGEKSEFDRILEQIIFSHLSTQDRLGASSLDELIQLRTETIKAKRRKTERKLEELNARISSIEQKIEPRHKRRVREEYRQKRREWWDLKRSRPDRIEEPAEDGPERTETRDQIAALSLAREHLRVLQQETEERLSTVNRRTVRLQSLLTDLMQVEQRHDDIVKEYEALLTGLGITGEFIQIILDRRPLEQAADDLKIRHRGLDRLLVSDETRSIPNAISYIDHQLELLRAELSQDEDEREEYLENVREWQEQLDALLGAPDQPESVLGARRAVQSLRNLPEELEHLREERWDLVERLHQLLVQESNLFSTLYEPLKNHLNEQPLPDDYSVDIRTSLVDEGFADRFLESFINRQVSGSFSGVAESRQAVAKLSEATNFNDTSSVRRFLTQIHKRLHADHRQKSPPRVSVASQLRKSKTTEELYDMIFGLRYLSPRYALHFGETPIHQLSPGEKGVLLLIFFLIADLDNSPLIIDQPEDNLDNQTVFNLLVDCFHQAKKRRQVIIVTHNPNLAVVCDADQVIVASMESEGTKRLRYTAGAIEDPEINQAMVDILEGTKPAFDHRGSTYNLHDQ